MDKNAWFDYSSLLCNKFLHHEENLEPTILITFGSSFSPSYIGRESFQSIYDLVTSWPCWDLDSTQWNTKIRFEILHEQISNSVYPHALKYYIESDEHNINNECITVVREESPLLVELNHTPNKHDISHVNVKCQFQHSEPFKLRHNASFSGVQVVKQIVLEVHTHFTWKYIFSLVWAFPYIDDKESINLSLIFKSDPLCKFEIVCQKNEPSEHTLWQYLSESILLKIHETIPNNYRSSEGVSVSFPS